MSRMSSRGIHIALGLAIAERCVDGDISQGRLSNLADVTDETICDLTRGLGIMTSQLDRIARALGAKASELWARAEAIEARGGA